MKAQDLKDLSKEELQKKERESREELFKLRVQKSIGQAKNTARFKILRREVARILTVRREQELKGSAVGK
ncbi:MAG: 50S ribosomal protein L29 [Deltaproteobacteria bacterium]|nr:50S ribosomal protein L29 [Deltaproteobacteria bacterium]